jgi:DUF4097 and DUF4098 domain-containing protein YvlB
MMVERQFPTPEPVRLELKIPAGEIHVASAEPGESTVSLAGPQNLVDATTIDFAGDRLVVQLRRKLFSGMNGSLTVHVRIPHGSRVDTATASADVVLEGTFASVDAKSASGDLRAVGSVDGTAVVNTVSGEARLTHVGGNLDVRTVSGNLRAEAVDGSVTVQSVSADVRIGSLREGKVSVQSVSGDVELGVVPGTDVDVEADSASGEVTSELPLSGSPAAEPADRMLVVRSRTVSGDFRLIRAA